MSEIGSKISFDLLDSFQHVIGFSTTRHGGTSHGNYSSFNLSSTVGDDSEHLLFNKFHLCEEIGVSPEHLVIPVQTHDTQVRRIDADFFKLDSDLKFNYLQGVDALITDLPDICIGVTTADCVPLLFYDSKKQVTAVAHAGWRGTCTRIAEKTIVALHDAYHSNPADLYVVIAPSVSPAVYEVGEELMPEFEKNGFPVSLLFEKRNGTVFLDLWKANQWLLMQKGIPCNQIQVSGICTFTESEHFFSARRLGIKSGRFLSGIIVRNEKYQD